MVQTETGWEENRAFRSRDTARRWVWDGGTVQRARPRPNRHLLTCARCPRSAAGGRLGVVRAAFPASRRVFVRVRGSDRPARVEDETGRTRDGRRVKRSWCPCPRPSSPRRRRKDLYRQGQPPREHYGTHCLMVRLLAWSRGQRQGLPITTRTATPGRPTPRREGGDTHASQAVRPHTRWARPCGRLTPPKGS